MDTIAILRTLVGFDTTSRLSNLPLVHWMVAYLEEHGARIRLSYDDDGRKANVLASLGPDQVGGVVLSGHTDVVPVDGQDWNSDPFSLTRRGGRLYGRGTADMKGFIACCLAAVPALARTPLKRPIHLALSYDEEVGCLGVSRLLADLAANVPPPALVIVGEPTGMRIGDRHRGFFGYRTTFHGRAAHSSDPSAGASAIYAAAEFVRFLRAAGDDGGTGIDRTTFNVGRIDGGTAINIVPHRCEVVWEFRPSAGSDVDAIRTTVDDFMARSAVHDVKLDHAALTSVPPLAPRDDNAALRLAHYLGAELPTLAMPFGTEAGFFQAAGIPTVVCGPGSIDQAHQPDEWITVAQLEAGSRFLDRLGAWASTEAQP
jgi:acetylornithine deacetylase